MADVPPLVLADLSAGRCETVNLMEWLATDMTVLARTVAAELRDEAVSEALRSASVLMPGLGVTQRLLIAGAAVARSTEISGPAFRRLAEHRSDIVRQWACYAVNDAGLALGLDVRLARTLEFAADPNMSVRETAWMAFRPHLAADIERGLMLLEPVSRHEDGSIRRFAVEVTRPRSVWGAHLESLKRNPGAALELLENVKTDPSRYVQLAAGNWLNDASKTRPDWVEELCARWSTDESAPTRHIIRRGLRSLSRTKVNSTSLPLPYGKAHT